jgi:hypothetical protein
MTPIRVVAMSLGLMGLLSCASQYEREIETRMVGQAARDVQRCLGAAEYFDRRGDGVELWAYSAPLSEPQDVVEIERTTGRGTDSQRPRIQRGRPLIGSGRLEASVGHGGPVRPGTCLFVFEMRNGAVHAFQTRGRSRSNMNSDEQCAALVERCLPESAERVDKGAERVDP